MSPHAGPIEPRPGVGIAVPGGTLSVPHRPTVSGITIHPRALSSSAVNSGSVRPSAVWAAATSADDSGLKPAA